MAHGERFTEEGLYRHSWDDGLLDVLSGLWLLLTGIGWLAGFGGLAGLHAPFWLVLWRPLHRGIVEPRAGFVRFSRSRRHRTRQQLWLTLVVGVSILALVLAVRDAGARGALASMSPGLPALLVALAAILTGILTGAGRFHLYAAGLIGAASCTIVLRLEPAPALIAGGVLVLTTGIWLVARFISASRLDREVPSR